MLKSTPPAWAGTMIAPVLDKVVQLKSTPPAWAGTDFKCLDPFWQEA